MSKTSNNGDVMNNSNHLQERIKTFVSHTNKTKWELKFKQEDNGLCLWWIYKNGEYQRHGIGSDSLGDVKVVGETLRIMVGYTPNIYQ